MPDTPARKRPPTSGTRKGNGPGWGGAAKGAPARAEMAPPFEVGNQAAAGHHDMSRSQRIEHLVLRLMQMGDTAGEERDRITAALGALRHLAGDTTKIEMSGPNGGPMQTEMIDRPPPETREQWVARRQHELDVARAMLVAPAGTAD